MLLTRARAITFCASDRPGKCHEVAEQPGCQHQQLTLSSSSVIWSCARQQMREASGSPRLRRTNKMQLLLAAAGVRQAEEGSSARSY